MKSLTRSALRSLHLSIQIEQEIRRRAAARQGSAEALEADPIAWLQSLYPSYVRHPFAERHRDLWAWVWSIRPGERPPPFVAIWPRGGAKSTSAELGAVALGARKARPYGLYICQTQDQADDHVGNIAALLEAPSIAKYYPDLAARMVGKYGNVKGWRRNRLRTASGFTVDALGLDSAARGAKIDEHRPGFMVIDDIDGELDSIATTAKKIATLTKKILPAGSEDLAVLGVQNLIHADSVFAQLADRRATFLNDRIVSGPHPAIVGMTYEQQAERFVITGGRPTWAGQDLQRCQAILNDIGITAFLSECQQEVETPPGGMFDHLVYTRVTFDQLPALVDVQVWCDPAVTDTDNSDSHGLQVDGLGEDGKIYRLFSWEARTTPLDVMQRAIRAALRFRASVVGVETDQGGDTWSSVYAEAWAGLVAQGEILFGTPRPRFKGAKASAGHGPKTHRAALMLAAYERGEIVHVEGTHQILERALRRFPKNKPFDLVDAAYWAWQGLQGLDLGTATEGDNPFADYRG